LLASRRFFPKRSERFILTVNFCLQYVACVFSILPGEIIIPGIAFLVSPHD